jgi:hypothetical protein
VASIVMNVVDLGRSKNKGKQAVQAILALHDARTTCQEDVRQLENKLLDATDDGQCDIQDVSMRLQDARNSKAKVSAKLDRMMAALGVDERADLRTLINDAYLRHQMNARALKERLRNRLRQRKFELEMLERAYRRTINGICIHSII